MDYDEIKNTFIANLKRIHKTSGLKLIFVAQKLEVDRITVQYWFSGKNFPSTEKIIKLAEIYGVDWLEFFLPTKDIEN